MATPVPSVSHVTISESIATDHVAPTPFVPGDANLFPKWPTKLDKSSFDAWQIHGMAADSSAAVNVIFFRHTAAAPRGFRVMINASWAEPSGDATEETVWNGDVMAPHSIITADPAGGVTGVWAADDAGAPPAARFHVTADLSRATITFDVPGRVVGTMTLKAVAGFDATLPQTDAAARFMPTFWWLRPIAMAGVTADLTFFPQDPNQKARPGNYASDSFPDAGKQLTLREDGDAGRVALGAMERGWSPVLTVKCLSHNWWLWARAGPYVIQVVWSQGRPEELRELWGSGRLYRDGRLVCAPQKAVELDAPEEDGETMTMEYLYHEEGKARGGITAPYRIKNVGHHIAFRSGKKAGGQTWVFESTQTRSWWNHPMSPPGPNASGLSGFVLSMSGGLTGSAEMFEGPGIVGGGVFPS